MCICVIWYTQIMEYFDERCSQKFICARMLILQKREKNKKYTRRHISSRSLRNSIAKTRRESETSCEPDPTSPPAVKPTCYLLSSRIQS